MFRDRAFFRVHSDFIQAAARGAMAAVNGELHPLNPGDPDRWVWSVTMATPCHSCCPVGITCISGIIYSSVLGLMGVVTLRILAGKRRGTLQLLVIDSY